ncbi:NR LBD domain-containing protein [Caenorhabditis elegans]|uniref:NR LBD domain-containing protein n=1 Tax=Caenorhabditis elegans TaxID=6239 RepID=O45954_CAEEL|nr:NR LBD domain-containing protein [Caenorhabditis elegans]CAA16390.2 NR LBD domain-containing protein [Caenorhabditis elegans]|eukprot:NP_507595.2 Nuclear Hormone Receptor family [Caenorhabditis elegans]
MVYGLRKIRAHQSWDPKFFKNINFLDIFSYWKIHMEYVATWLMHSNEFRSLPNHEKLAIFKTVWAIWRRFERYAMSAEIFGKRCYEEKIIVHSDDSASKFGELYVDYSLVSDKGFEKIRSVLGGRLIKYFDIIVKPYLELNLTETEVTYILCQIVCNYAGRRLQGQIQAAGERFLEEISDNLHSYYKNLREKFENYALRLAKMMQIVNQMLNIQLKSKNNMDVAMLFDMFNIIFTDPDFFRVQ